MSFRTGAEKVQIAAFFISAILIQKGAVTTFLEGFLVVSVLIIFEPFLRIYAAVTELQRNEIIRISCSGRIVFFWSNRPEKAW